MFAMLVAACGDDPPVVQDASLVDAASDAAPDAEMVIDAPRLCDSETRDDEYTAGMTRIGANGYTVALLDSVPLPARKGKYTWTIRVVDPAMTPATGFDVRVTPTMPDHGHGTSPSTITPGSDGTYTISQMDLFMTGLWNIRIAIRDASSELDFVAYKFCVD